MVSVSGPLGPSLLLTKSPSIAVLGRDSRVQPICGRHGGRAAPDPPGLTEREAELAELAAFCLKESDDAGYVWWQAGPWAGKSALMSTFVLQPQAQVRQRVQFVSFFITARLAAQDTREAFSQVVLEQLATLTGQELPAVLPGGDPRRVPIGPACPGPQQQCHAQKTSGWSW